MLLEPSACREYVSMHHLLNVGAGEYLLDGPHLLADPGEIGGEYGGRHNDRIRHAPFSF